MHVSKILNGIRNHGLDIFFYVIILLSITDQWWLPIISQMTPTKQLGSWGTVIHYILILIFSINFFIIIYRDILTRYILALSLPIILLLSLTDRLWIRFVVSSTVLRQYKFSGTVINYALILIILVISFLIIYRAVVSHRFHSSGYKYATQGNYTAAIENYNKAIKLQSNDSSLYYNRGMAFKNIQEYQAALLEFTKAIKLKPQDAGCYYMRGVVNIFLEDFSAALNDYNKVIELRSNGAGAFANRAYVHEKMKNFSQSLADYRKAIEIDPKFATAYFYLGGLFEELNRFDEAEQAYRKAIEFKTDDPEYYFQLGLLLHTQFHRYSEAELMFGKTLELNPQDETALYDLACIKSINKDTESAFGYLRDAIQKGFDRAWAWDDPDLDSLKDDPRFIEIVGPRPEKKSGLTVQQLYGANHTL
jgi:tetratricopeptide (TPR) repeat protein